MIYGRMEIVIPQSPVFNGLAILPGAVRNTTIHRSLFRYLSHKLPLIIPLCM